MQNKFIFLSVIVLIGISVIGINQSFAQTDVEIPPWVKGVASFWVEGNIDDGEFAEALEFMIDSNIIQLDGDVMQLDSNIMELGNTVSVPEQKNDWKEKYDKQEKEYKSKSYRATQEHNKIANEMDEKYNAMMKRQQIAEDKNKKEWRETHSKLSEENSKLSEENTKLKTKIKELEK